MGIIAKLLTESEYSATMALATNTEFNDIILNSSLCKALQDCAYTFYILKYDEHKAKALDKMPNFTFIVAMAKYHASMAK